MTSRRLQRHRSAPGAPRVVSLFAGLIMPMTFASCGRWSSNAPTSVDLEIKIPAPTVPPRVDGEPLELYAARLGDPDAAVRRDAVEALSTHAASSMPHLAAAGAALVDPDPRVRWATLEWLGRVGPDAAVHAEAVVGCLSDEVVGVRAAAARAASQIPATAPSLVTVLAARTTDGNSGRRGLARTALVALGADIPDAPGIAARLAPLLSADDPGPAEDAADVLAVLGEAGLGPLMEALAHEEGFVVVLATGALTKMGPVAAPAVDPLSAAILRRGGDVRRTAFDTLVAIGAPARAQLEALAASDNEAISEAAQLALSRLR